MDSRRYCRLRPQPAFFSPLPLELTCKDFLDDNSRRHTAPEGWGICACRLIGGQWYWVRGPTLKPKICD